jgi:hypothetical protein
MDPGWETCPYCANEAGGQRAAPAGGSSKEPPPLPPPPSNQRRATMLESSPVRPPTVPEAPSASVRASVPQPPRPAPAPARGKTVFADPSPAAPAAEPGLRRIVALLVTYTWRADGEVFPVREGRNYLGSGPECEICLSSDPQLSSRHATIVYRGKDFWIDDEKSMNGTFVNGEVIEERQRLANYSTLKTGATVWHFLTVAPTVES